MGSEPETEKDDVAGHIRDEYMPEHQHTDGVHQAGGEGQEQQSDNREAIGYRRGNSHEPSIAVKTPDSAEMEMA